MGKTSFINRITKGYFMDNLSSTLGVDFQVKTFRVDERNIAIQLWDTAGQVRTFDYSTLMECLINFPQEPVNKSIHEMLCF